MKKILTTLFCCLSLLGMAESASATYAPGGSAVYREGSIFNAHEHAGVMINSSYVYEIKGYETDDIEVSTLSEFKAGSTYYGTYTHKNGLTSTQRDSILSTAAALEKDTGLTYTMYDQINWDSDAGSYISVYEITDIRCDGVVEYSYEWNNIWVWGRTSGGTASTNPTHFDVSYVPYAKEHANLGSDSPWVEVSPKVQRGSNGGCGCDPLTFTQLRKE